MQGIIGTENLSIVYDKGTPKEFTALKGITFHAEPGEFIIVFGPSGCGKSTLLYMLSGIERHIDKGSAWVNGKDIVNMNDKDLLNIHRHDVGMIFQAYNLIGTLNILSNVTLPLLAIGASEKSREERAQALLERFGVGHLAKRYPAELSGGQQQRVAVARSLITNPSILFADEPTGNLDAISTEVVIKSLLELREKDKKTILMVTHDPTFLHYADRVVYLKDGNLVKVDVQKGVREFNPHPEDEQAIAKVVSDSAADANAFGNSPYDVDRKGEISLDDMVWISVVPKFVQYVRKESGTFLERRLLRVFLDVATKKLSNRDTLVILEKPMMDGGFGYTHERASAIVIEFQELTDLRQWLLKYPPRQRLDSLAFIHISRYALGKLFGTLSTVQSRRLKTGLVDFMSHKINQTTFVKEMSTSVEQGGVGFDEARLNDMCEKVGLIEDLIT